VICLTLTRRPGAPLCPQSAGASPAAALGPSRACHVRLRRLGICRCHRCLETQNFQGNKKTSLLAKKEEAMPIDFHAHAYCLFAYCTLLVYNLEHKHCNGWSKEPRPCPLANQPTTSTSGTENFCHRRVQCHDRCYL
jgi:hypothetical protein